MSDKIVDFVNIRVVLLSTLVILCLFGIIKAMNMGGANLDFYRVHQTLEFWRKNNQITSVESFEQTLHSIQKANEKHPNNPQYLITQGLVYEWGGINAAEQSKREYYFNEAKAYYLRAVELRPTWPGTWATLATLKWRMNELDQQMIDYLLLADKFGRNTDQVHEAWLDVGLHIYKSKSVYSAQIINGLRAHLQLMVEDPRNKIQHSALEIIKRHRVERLACNWVTNFELEDETKKKMFCQ